MNNIQLRIKILSNFFCEPPIHKCKIKYININTDIKGDYCAICAIIKNKAPYLKEWIEYHKLKGIKKFLLYDNESEDNTYKILESYILKGTVIYHKIIGKNNNYLHIMIVLQDTNLY